MWYRLTHPIKNLYKRWRYGAGCCDVFSLDYYLAKKILPTLKRFKETGINSWPCCDDFPKCEDWEKAVDKMIWSFQYLVDGEDDCRTDGVYDNEKNLANYKREQEGFELFGKHFRSLWK